MIDNTLLTDLLYSGRITAVAPDSLAAELDLRPGDELLSINGHPLRDVIDVQFYSAQEVLELLVRRDGELTLYEAERDYDQPLGIEFAHPTFDVDIRRCNNLCEFCFVLQTAPRMRRTLYVKDDDYRYSFLLGHYITLTNLSDEDWARIEEQHLSPLYVSVHATDLALRRQILRNPDAPDVLAQLDWLGQRGIETHTQIVVTPGLNDGPHLDRSIADLATLWPALRSVSVVPVGITRHHKYGHRPNTRAEARIVFEQVSAWQQKFLAEIGVRFAYLTDEWYLVLDEPIPPMPAYDGLELQENGLGTVRKFLDEWQQLGPDQSNLGTKSKDFSAGIRGLGDRSRKIPSSPNPGPVGSGLSGLGIRDWGLGIGKVTLVTGVLFAPVLNTVAAEFSELTGIDVGVVPVINRRLGETITVAGLLMGQDIIHQLQGREMGELVVLPRITFDHPDGVALDDVSPAQITQALDRKVVLADTMRDVWEAVQRINGSNNG